MLKQNSSIGISPLSGACPSARRSVSSSQVCSDIAWIGPMGAHTGALWEGIPTGTGTLQRANKVQHHRVPCDSAEAASTPEFSSCSLQVGPQPRACEKKTPCSRLQPGDGSGFG